LGARLGLGNLFLKDESANPTGSFKDRGLSVALSLAKAFSVSEVILPTAGNAGASAAAYGARAGISVSIHAPEGTPAEILAEIRLRDVRLALHPGTIADAGRAAAAECAQRGSHSRATFREPGRVEGKKTMAYELREDLGRMPDAIVYPCGGGTGIVAMAQAVEEMKELKWIGQERPRLYAVQAAGCAPIVEAFAKGRDRAEPWDDTCTIAAGLNVPAPFADREILAALYRTEGGALDVSEDEILEAGLELSRTEGILPCPEGAAALAGTKRLLSENAIRANELIVVFQTGSGLKYLGAWREATAGLTRSRSASDRKESPASPRSPG
jgi:threonine synthase